MFKKNTPFREFNKLLILSLPFLGINHAFNHFISLYHAFFKPYVIQQLVQVSIYFVS